jgi:predicted DNA-binding protein with PD1-like motif
VRSRVIHQANGQRTFALIFETGDEFVSTLTRFAQHEGLEFAHYSGIGAFRSVLLGYFNWDRRDYDHIRFDEQMEVLSLSGDVASKDGKPTLHAHVVLGARDGTARGGHLFEGHVRPTLEVVLTETSAHLRRTVHEESGLALIDLAAK